MFKQFKMIEPITPTILVQKALDILPKGIFILLEKSAMLCVPEDNIPVVVIIATVSPKNVPIRPNAIEIDGSIFAIFSSFSILFSIFF